MKNQSKPLIIKRDGSTVEFDCDKIIAAITKAYEGEGEPSYASKIAKIIESNARKFHNDDNPVTVEEVQDEVENLLMGYDKEAAKNYIRYRYKRKTARMLSANFIDAVTEKLQAKHVLNDNANMDEASFGGRVGEASNVLMKQYALDYCMKPRSKENHINNRIYQHDLNAYAIGQHNCLTCPIDELLANGFKTRQTDVRPAKSVNTALQLVAVIFQLQSLMQFGGVSSSHLDWSMVPYVRMSFFKHWKDGHKYVLQDTNADDLVFFKDHSIEDEYYKDGAYQFALDMTEKEVKQGMEGLFHNLK